MRYRIKEFVSYYHLKQYVPQYKSSFWPFWISWCGAFEDLDLAKKEAEHMKKYFETKDKYYYDI